MISEEKLNKLKEELDKYTDVALIAVLYDRAVCDMTNKVLIGEK